MRNEIPSLMWLIKFGLHETAMVYYSHKLLQPTYRWHMAIRFVEMKLENAG